jgi:hypothetical protein
VGVGQVGVGQVACRSSGVSVKWRVGQVGVSQVGVGQVGVGQVAFKREKISQSKHLRKSNAKSLML